MPTATETATGISPVSKESAAPEIQPILDKLTHGFGKVPAFFGTQCWSTSTRVRIDASTIAGSISGMQR